MSYPDSKTRRGLVQAGGSVSPTITAQSNGLCRLEIYDDYNSRSQADQTCINTIRPNNSSKATRNGTKLIEYGYRIRVRKLTPKECWRLMGFDDESFTRAECVNSNSQLYKQAGNSIVVNVLMAIFKEMLGE